LLVPALIILAPPAAGLAQLRYNVPSNSTL